MYLENVIKGAAAAVQERTGVNVLDIRKEHYTVIVRTIFFYCVIDELKITHSALATILGSYRARPTITYAVGRFKQWNAEPKFYKTELFWSEILSPIIRDEINKRKNV